MKYKFIYFLFHFIFYSSILFSNDQINGNINSGKELFEKNCTACHVMGKQLIGPDLTKIVSRLKKEENLGREWLQKWISNNISLRASGDIYANKIFEKYNKIEMQNFPNLLEKDIDDILSYLENPIEESVEKKPSLDNNKIENDISNNTIKHNFNQDLIFISFLIIIGLLSWIAFKINNLVKLTENKEKITKNNINYIKILVSYFSKYNKIFYALYFVLFIFSLYGVWSILFGIGVDKGYKPIQPIYFSHKIHAGINKINCELCHSSAKYSKVSGIPSLNNCMNCHRLISEYKGEYLENGKTREFYNKEIKKIYKYVGWNEIKQNYSNNQKPIKWVRIHNMPDFVYFNHSQHTVVGKNVIIDSHNKKDINNQSNISCTACHGKVDTMNRLEMANNFTMGWCIDCHKTTKIDINNTYNSFYLQKIHNKIHKMKKENKKITVSEVGGLECGKCHY